MKPYCLEDDYVFTYSRCVSGVATVPAASTQEGRGETDAQEVRARHHVSPLKETALPLRRLHVTNKVSPFYLSSCCQKISLFRFFFPFVDL